MGITQNLCRAAAGITWEALPPEAIDAAKRLVLDGIAIALAGSREEQAPRILAAHLQDLGGAERCTAIGFSFRTSPVHAAYLNGASMHVLDYEPMWSPPNHATSTTLPAVLALAEDLEADGRQVITALIKGCEVQQRLRAASGQVEPKDLTFHPPGVVGGIGAAVGAAHLLGLGIDALRNAVGIAASRAGALLANVGSMTKCTHCGLAGAMGVDAALLAERGFTANADIVEAPRGYAEAYFGSAFDAGALEDFGRPFRIIDPGYAIKMFPSQFATHYAISAALDLHPQLSGPDAIEAVNLQTPIMPYVDRPRPANGLDGKFSFQYTTACALLDGSVGVASFSDERRFRSDVQRLLPRVRLSQTDGIPGALDRMHVALEVELAGGERLSSACHCLRGAWGDPIPFEDHMIKLRDCLTRTLDDRAIEILVDGVQRLEELDSAELSGLMRRLQAHAP